MSTRNIFSTTSISPSSKQPKTNPPSPHHALPPPPPPGPQQTLLATLHARALDTTRHPHPLLHDTHAVETLHNLVSNQGDGDHEITTNTGMSLPESAGICLRSLALDAWTSAFLRRHSHEPVTVEHLACGLDARCFRVAHGEGVRWVDVDLEEVVELRRRVMPSPKGEYSLVVGSAGDLDGWPRGVPADRPTVVVFEGLTMYLREEEGRRLVEGVVGRFGGVHGGEIVCDVFGRGVVGRQREVAVVRNSGAVWYWGVDEPGELETWCGGGLRFVEERLTMEGHGLADDCVED